MLTQLLAPPLLDQGSSGQVQQAPKVEAWAEQQKAPTPGPLALQQVSFDGGTSAHGSAKGGVDGGDSVVVNVLPSESKRSIKFADVKPVSIAWKDISFSVQLKMKQADGSMVSVRSFMSLDLMSFARWHAH